MERGGGSGRRETVVDESRKETADRVANYQIDYVVGRTCLFYSYCCGCLGGFFCASVFLSLPLALSRILIVYVVLFSFVCHISGKGTTPHFN